MNSFAIIFCIKVDILYAKEKILEPVKLLQIITTDDCNYRLNKTL